MLRDKPQYRLLFAGQVLSILGDRVTSVVLPFAVLAAVYGAADAFFAPAFTGLLPGTVAPVNLQPANALRGLSFSTGPSRAR